MSLSGAKKEGTAGFFKGIGKGLVGVVARPTGSIVDMASSTFQGIQRYGSHHATCLSDLDFCVTLFTRSLERLFFLQEESTCSPCLLSSQFFLSAD